MSRRETNGYTSHAPLRCNGMVRPIGNKEFTSAASGVGTLVQMSSNSLP